MRVGYIAMPQAPDEFEQLVDESIEALPEWVHKVMDNVQVFVEDAPPPDQPTLLGVYQGIPLAKRGTQYTWAVPDQHHAFPFDHRGCCPR